MIARLHAPARWRSLIRTWPYVRPYRRQMLVMFFAAAGGVAASIVVPLITKSVIDGPIRHHQSARLLPLALLALAFGAAEAFLAFIRRWVQTDAVLGMETALRHDLYAHVQGLSVGFHDQWQSGQLLSRITTDLSTIRRFIGFGAIFLVVNAGTYLAVIVLLIGLSVPLGVLVAASALPIIWLSARFERGYVVVSRRVQDQQGDLATLVEESAAGLRVIKSFGRAAYMNDRFGVAARALRGSALERVRLQARFWTVLEAIPNLTLAVVLLLGAVAVHHDALTLGGLIAFISLMLTLVWPVQALGYILAMAQEAMTAADRIYDVFDTVPAIVDRPGARALPRAEGRLRFEGVAFRYPGSDRDVLHDVWLDVAPGETVAIVGATGSGKSTLTALVPRLYDVTAGRITIDDVDIRDLRLDSLRAIVGMAFEDPTLFSASAAENVLLGNPAATEAELERALAIAQADFVRDLPWGLATRIGEQGLAISGGQRQRLALARALVTEPRVLVLDDPLSALDVHTEALVESALRRVLATATALVAVHRPSTVALADRVALLEGGTITHVGPHSDLMATVPAYRAILSAEVDDGIEAAS